jgi:hypothetical protein
MKNLPQFHYDELNMTNAVAPDLNQTVDGAVPCAVSKVTTVQTDASAVPNVIGFYQTDPNQISESEIAAKYLLRNVVLHRGQKHIPLCGTWIKVVHAGHRAVCSSNGIGSFAAMIACGAINVPS